MALFRKIYFDGCNGWKLGSTLETEPCEDGALFDEDGTQFGSRNDDGLFEDEEGQQLLVPI